MWRCNSKELNEKQNKNEMINRHKPAVDYIASLGVDSFRENCFFLVE